MSLWTRYRYPWHSVHSSQPIARFYLTMVYSLDSQNPKIVHWPPMTGAVRKETQVQNLRRRLHVPLMMHLFLVNQEASCQYSHEDATPVKHSTRQKKKEKKNVTCIPKTKAWEGWKDASQLFGLSTVNLTYMLKMVASIRLFLSRKYCLNTQFRK